MADKPWKLTTTQYSALDLHMAARGFKVKPPTVTEKFYRWRWLAAFEAFHVNSFTAMNPAISMVCPIYARVDHR